MGVFRWQKILLAILAGSTAVFIRDRCTHGCAGEHRVENVLLASPGGVHRRVLQDDVPRLVMVEVEGGIRVVEVLVSFGVIF